MMKIYTKIAKDAKKTSGTLAKARDPESIEWAAGPAAFAPSATFV